MAKSIDQRIEEIEAMLASGVSSQSHGARSWSFDLGELRSELERLQAQQNRSARNGQTRRGVYVNRGY